MTARRLWRAASEAELRQTMKQAALSYSAHQITAMRRAARAPRQDSLSWPLQVCDAYRQAVQSEISDSRIMCAPPDPQFLLDRWLPSRAARLAELLDWLVEEAGAEPALQLFLAHLKPVSVIAAGAAAAHGGDHHQDDQDRVAAHAWHPVRPGRAGIP